MLPINAARGERREYETGRSRGTLLHACCELVWRVELSAVEHRLDPLRDLLVDVGV
jgi:hypothetical protein